MNLLNSHIDGQWQSPHLETFALKPFICGLEQKFYSELAH